MNEFLEETRKFIIIIGICLTVYVILSLCTSCSSSCANKGSEIRVTTFHYEGHRYLKFTDPFFYERMGIEHDPECLKRDLKR